MPCVATGNNTIMLKQHQEVLREHNSSDLLGEIDIKTTSRHAKYLKKNSLLAK